jgi:hypothetical protein
VYASLFFRLRRRFPTEHVLNRAGRRSAGQGPFLSGGKLYTTSCAFEGVCEEFFQSKVACFAGFLPGSKLSARLFHGKAGGGSEFPTVPVWWLETMCHFDMQGRIFGRSRHKALVVAVQAGGLLSLGHRRLGRAAASDANRVCLIGRHCESELTLPIWLKTRIVI